ncbi:MAG: 30S ribosomal protein S18 [Deltaproteobacteria bacterium]|nr:30S ribosomal protein S18 [Deltaproteobacteria bacterium]
MDQDRDYEDEGRGGKEGGREAGSRRVSRRRLCRYCADKDVKVDFKDITGLRAFITDRGKLVPRRISGNCAKHQRAVVRAIKQARNIALMPFSVS